MAEWRTHTCHGGDLHRRRAENSERKDRKRGRESAHRGFRVVVRVILADLSHDSHHEAPYVYTLATPFKPRQRVAPTWTYAKSRQAPRARDHSSTTTPPQVWARV